MNKAIAFTLLVGLAMMGVAYAAEGDEKGFAADVGFGGGGFPPKGPKTPHQHHHGNLPFPVKTTPFPQPPRPEETTPEPQNDGFEPGVEKGKPEMYGDIEASDTTPEEVEETTPEPKTTTPEPETTTPEPETTTPEPETTTPEPTTPEPKPTTPEPETTTPEPTTPEPKPTTPEPETTTPEPIPVAEPVKINAMYKENRVNRRRSVPGVMDVHGESVNVSPEVKTTVALMQDILAARANSAANSEANGGRRSSQGKTFTINV